MNSVTKGQVKVLWVIRQLDFGGAEVLLRELARAFDLEAFDLGIYSLIIPNEAFYREFSNYGVKVSSAGVKSIKDPRWVLRLTKFIKEGSYDIAHSHSPIAAIMLRIFCLVRFFRLNLVSTEHAVFSSYKKMIALLDYATGWKDNKIIAVSHAVKNSLPRRLKQKSIVIYHGIDLERIKCKKVSRTQLPELRSLPRDLKLICSVANFRREKDYYTLVSAVKLLEKQLDKFQMIIIGVGDYLPVLSLVKQLALQEKVSILGKRDSAIDYIAASDVFVLSSYYEGLPVVLMEAAACGVPVVATKVGGVPEIVENNKNGFLIDPRSPEKFAKALFNLLTQDALYAKCSKHQLEKSRLFDSRKTAQQYMQVYKSLVG